METYVITLSQVFPSTHCRAGEPTYFHEMMHNALTGQDFSLHQTGRDDSYGETVICCETIREKKLHTIRANYWFWEKRFERIERGEACLSIRQWTGKPYRSKQIELARLTREDGIGLQRLDLFNNILGGYIDDKPIQDLSILAENDGLSYGDWLEWFKNYNLSQPMAIIHFTSFRY